MNDRFGRFEGLHDQVRQRLVHGVADAMAPIGQGCDMIHRLPP